MDLWGVPFASKLYVLFCLLKGEVYEVLVDAFLRPQGIYTPSARLNLVSSGQDYMEHTTIHPQCDQITNKSRLQKKFPLLLPSTLVVNSFFQFPFFTEVQEVLQCTHSAVTKYRPEKIGKKSQ